MEDRVPTPGQEGRVLITPEDGSAPYYATLTMADNPTNPGTPLNKETLLQDATETALFGSAENRTVDEAFRGIANKLDLIMGDQASITVTVTDQAGHPVTQALVNGVYGEDGSTVYTNSSGVASGYIAEGTQTISITGYADLEDTSKQLDVVKGTTITETLTPTRRNFLHLTQSRSVKFSGDVSTVDSNPVGGGGCAGEGSVQSGGYGASGGGAGGGYSTIQSGIQITPNTMYPAIVGSGGAIPNAVGGTSSFLGVTASGGNAGGNAAPQGQSPGSGGTGNGIGANGVRSGSKTSGLSGALGTQTAFSSFSDTQIAGGGGDSGEIFFSLSDRGEDGASGTDGYGEGGSSGSVNRGANESGYHGSVGAPGRGGHGSVNMRIHFTWGDLAA